MASKLAWYEPAKCDAQKLSWLALTQEEALEPSLPIIDAHHHLWDCRAPNYESAPMAFDPAKFGWQRRYLLDDFTADISGGHNIVATVFVQCGTMYRTAGPKEMRCVGETEFVAGVAAMADSKTFGPCAVCAGIVATADLTLGAAVEDVLLAHKAAAGGRLRGVRTTIAPDDDKWVEGVKVVERMGLVFDVFCFASQLPELARVARAFPSLTIVLNHCGGIPGPASFDGKPEAEAAWRQSISELASLDNVYAKCGGVQMVPNGLKDDDGVELHNRSAPIGSRDLSQLTYGTYAHVISAFGALRCMFESNFPVDKVTISYQVFWNSVKLVAERLGLSADEKKAIFAGTAAKVYKLELELGDRPTA